MLGFFVLTYYLVLPFLLLLKKTQAISKTFIYMFFFEVFMLGLICPPTSYRLLELGLPELACNIILGTITILKYTTPIILCFLLYWEVILNRISNRIKHVK
jgi:hypothetical protein